MKKILLSFTLILVATFDNVSNAQSDFVKPQQKKANIKCIIPPSGFDTLSLINGYYHRIFGASIILTTVDGRSVEDAENGLNSAQLKSMEMELVSKSTMKLNDGREMLLFKTKYDFKETKWGRLQGFVGEDNSVLWVVVSYPLEYQDKLEGILLKSLRTLKFDKR